MTKVEVRQAVRNETRAAAHVKANAPAQVEAKCIAKAKPALKAEAAGIVIKARVKAANGMHGVDARGAASTQSRTRARNPGHDHGKTRT